MNPHKKIKDLKLMDTVEINGKEYLYIGINKVRIKGVGLVEKLVFYNKEIGDKLFDLKVLNADLKQSNGKLIYKP